MIRVLRAILALTLVIGPLIVLMALVAPSAGDIVDVPDPAAVRLADTILHASIEKIAGENDTESWSCLGATIKPDWLPRVVQMIVTAGHCLAPLGGNQSHRSLAITNCAYGFVDCRVIRYRLQSPMWWSTPDAGIILVAPAYGHSFFDGYYLADPPASTSVISMISIGGGEPTPATGMVVSSDGEGVHALMPGGPGSSGGPVVDLHGKFVGIITGGSSYRTGGAGFYTTIVPYWKIIPLINSQEETILDGIAKWCHDQGPWPGCPEPAK